MTLLLVSLALAPRGVEARPPALSPLQSTAAQVIAGVNALRASQGLTPFQTNGTLMSVCQAQSDYMASIGTYSDTDAQGRSSKQRLIAAGYLAVRASENVFEGTNATAQQALAFWQGDALHRIALFDPDLRDVGAGVTVSDGVYYYCQIAALSGNASSGSSGTGGTGGTNAPAAPAVVPIVVSTPNPDGSIVHVVRPGDTLYAIAQAYGLPLLALEQLNTVTSTTIIYPGRKLTIRAAFTPTVTAPSATPRRTPTPGPSQTPHPPTETTTPAPGTSSSQAGGALVIIIFVALALAGAVTALGLREKR